LAKSSPQKKPLPVFFNLFDQSPSLVLLIIIIIIIIRRRKKCMIFIIIIIIIITITIKSNFTFAHKNILIACKFIKEKSLQKIIVMSTSKAKQSKAKH
jgi:hypothetical protein